MSVSSTGGCWLLHAAARRILLNRPLFRRRLVSGSHPGTSSMRTSAIIVLSALGLVDVSHAQSTPPASSAPTFITISNNAILSSRLIGLSVRSSTGENMGRIEDVVFEGGQISGVVLSIGEVLGIDRRYTA